MKSNLLARDYDLKELLGRWTVQLMKNDCLDCSWRLQVMLSSYLHRHTPVSWQAIELCLYRVTCSKGSERSTIEEPYSKTVQILGRGSVLPCPGQPASPAELLGIFRIGASIRRYSTNPGTSALWSHEAITAIYPLFKRLPKRKKCKMYGFRGH